MRDPRNWRYAIIFFACAIVLVGMFFLGRQTAPKGIDPNLELKQTIAVLEEQNRQYKAEARSAVKVGTEHKEASESIAIVRPHTQQVYHEEATRVLDLPAMQQYNVLAKQLVRLDSLIAPRH